MNKNLLIAGIALLGAGVLASCSSDPEFDSTDTILVSEESYSYDSDGVWTQNEKPGNLNIDDYEFSHIIDKNEYGTFVYGFTPSKVTDPSIHNPLDSFPYASASGGGVNGPGSPYLVGYWAEYLEGEPGAENIPFDQRTCRIYEEDGDRFQPQSVMVCNNTYLKYAALNGTAFTPKMGEGDFVTLIAHGVHQDGTEDTAVFYLINIEDTNTEAGILMAWKEFDLTGLGTCTGIYFTMDASDNFKSAYGLNIPTYFCIDQLKVKD